MRAVAQRVNSARVEVDGRVVGSIDRGLLVYLGAGAGDTAPGADWMAAKLASLRIFPDARDRMNEDVLAGGGQVLVVPQFTLYGDVRRGRRPSFEGACPPDAARDLFEEVCERLRARGVTVETGVFQAHMAVHAEVDGPVTILIDSDKLF